MIDWVQPRHFFGKLSARLAAPARKRMRDCFVPDSLLTTTPKTRYACGI